MSLSTLKIKTFLDKNLKVPGSGFRVKALVSGRWLLVTG
jgi:hypothetical protein